MQKAWFLDRDGTIIEDKHYLKDPEDIVVLDGVVQALQEAQKAGYLLIIVTNQSGIARGFFSTQDADRVDEKLSEILALYGITITKSYRCPHLQDGNPPYNISCSCRKPNTGMFEQAIKDYGLDPSLCIACGDKLRDVERLPDIGVLKENTGVIDGVEFHSILDFYKKVTAAE